MRFLGLFITLLSTTLVGAVPLVETAVPVAAALGKRTTQKQLKPGFTTVFQGLASKVVVGLVSFIHEPAGLVGTGDLNVNAIVADGMADAIEREKTGVLLKGQEATYNALFSARDFFLSVSTSLTNKNAAFDTKMFQFDPVFEHVWASISNSLNGNLNQAN
ncbi:hypothetical protein NQ176_g1916 [Zarea fungicola]|uniref:Uncharacterized protein n=1 Tax=Zarea fungicola TaxID=93591 RepID=A0ACC1NQP5_9HYPO|nr:hypothetical protein NQ176_g1916 [Lecanicillium fungicola]